MASHFLDDGLPNVLDLDAYIGIIRNKSLLRRMITAYSGTATAAISEWLPADLLKEAASRFMELQNESTSRSRSPRVCRLAHYEFIGPDLSSRHEALPGIRKREPVTCISPFQVSEGPTGPSTLSRK